MQHDASYNMTVIPLDSDAAHIAIPSARYIRCILTPKNNLFFTNRYQAETCRSWSRRRHRACRVLDYRCRYRLEWPHCRTIVFGVGSEPWVFLSNGGVQGLRVSSALINNDNVAHSRKLVEPPRISGARRHNSATQRISNPEHRVCPAPLMFQT